MNGLVSLFRRNLVDSKWMLGIAFAALFGLSWLLVMFAASLERRIKSATDGTPREARFLRGMGGSSMDFSSAAIEMSLWNHPFIILTVAMWAVSRGSAAVSGELERGTMDMILSRPVPRPTFLLAHVLNAIAGLLLLGFALVIGNVIGTYYNVLENPPGFALLLKPALNLAALGVTMYGYTLVVSTITSVRWIPNLVGSVLTMTGYILNVIANLPGMDDWKFLEKFSIFKAFNPVEIVTEGTTFASNTALLSSIGAVGIILAFVVFARRDLPAGS